MAAKPTVLDRAKTAMITRHTFFSSILLKRKIRMMAGGTAGIDRRGHMFINPEWVAAKEMTVGNVVFLMAHECMHYMFMHAWRRGTRDKELWNIACDAVINETLIHMGVGEFIEGGVRWPGAHEKNAEEVYDELEQLQQQGQGSSVPELGGIGSDINESGTPGDQGDDDGDGSGGGGEGDEDGQGGGGQQPTEAEMRAEEAAIKIEMTQAQNAAKQMGQGHALMDRLIEEMLYAPTPWYEYMERFFTRSADNDYSFEKCDRRFVHKRIWLPGVDGHGMGKAGVIVDVSGSIDDRELAEFSGNINKILETCNPEKTVVAFCHTRVCKTDEYDSGEFPIRLECNESGGTDMTNAIDWFMKNHADVDALVVLTDGYTPFGHDPGVPIFWAMTTDVEAPYGETVKLELSYE